MVPIGNSVSDAGVHPKLVKVKSSVAVAVKFKNAPVEFVVLIIKSSKFAIIGGVVSEE